MTTTQGTLRSRRLRERGAWHVAIHHRRGRVPVGGVSVAIAVSAPRRRERAGPRWTRTCPGSRKCSAVVRARSRRGRPS